MITEEFKQAYARLNKAQKEAVDAIDGPVMVAAGPGTGKTQILALRIANILLKTDTKPENILAITFTESGVTAMRRRLRDIIGNGAYRVAINTFHGFCNEIIRNRPEDFPAIIGAVNITEADQVRVLEEVFSELTLDKLTTFGDPFYYLKDAKSAVGKLKQEGVSPEHLAAKIAEYEKSFWSIDDLYSTKKGYEGKLKTKYQDELRRIEKNKELAQVYAAYEAKLRAHKYYDFTDMIMQMLAALGRDEDLLLSLQETYQYLLVDEHQDTNNAQNGILELLAGHFSELNLFVVGDEKQAIFRFQGASLENFRYFRHKYPSVKMIVLEENYRSSQAILDSAHSLLAGEKRLLARAGHTALPIVVFEVATEEAEEYLVAKKISEQIVGGVKPEEIAVIYRENRDALPFGAMLGKLGVPYAIESNQDLLDDSAVRKLLVILRAVNDFGQSERFIESLHLDFLNIDPLDIFKFTAAVGKERVNAYDAGKHRHFLETAGVEEPNKILAWYAKLAELATLAKNEDAALAFEKIVRESGLLGAIIAGEDSVERIGKINTLFDEVQALIEKKRDAKLADLMAYLAMLDEHDIRLKKAGSEAPAGRVRLMTAHGAKGLEFDEVFIVRANDKHWGNKSHRELISLPPAIFAREGEEVIEEPDSNDEERRLFYVALTRAKKVVTISYAKQNRDLKELLPTMFLSELDPALWQAGDSRSYEASLAAEPGLRYAEPQSVGLRLADRDFIRDLFRTRGFAVTHLNNYLECPWKYFYMNLLRLPKAPERHMLYGSAVHKALEDFFNQFKENGEPSKEFLLAAFAGALAGQPIPESEYDTYLKRGEAALSGYYDEYHGTWRDNVLTEFDIKGIVLDDNTVLTGKIDKLEFLDGSNKVNVVDYKTGKPKSRGKIEGKADGEESEGAIKRQLAFYKLLLDRYDGGKYKMVSGEIDFVEPNASGKYKKEPFTVSETEVSDLETLIKRVADEILNFSFWDRRCDDKDCEFCALREMMK
ncbi:MAG: ATP-dependent DNA helicase [Candidatus Vogelbacteria bacterium]|nr:ATP-dependent DNA helicase [Candidatus Vogelbacteria bacterium]